VPWTTTITLLELEYGIHRIKYDLLRNGFRNRIDRALSSIIDSRILVFDEDAANVARRLWAEREAVGRPIEVRDLMIASVALSKGATLVTRNVRHFSGLGIGLENPWSSERQERIQPLGWLHSCHSHF
jgi:predicted nucleic acid-binding protein